MTFEEILDEVLAMLQRRGRLSYRAVMRQFALDEAYLEDIKEAILFAHPQIVDEEGRGLVWIGDVGAIPPAPASPQPLEQPVTLAPRVGQITVPPFAPQTPDAERRQLTVLFCDLVDSTVLARQLDPEDLREVVRAYQEVCAKVIARFEGYIAQYLGDGLLVYFGYPLAHEDDAQRAVRAGLGIVEAMRGLNTRLEQERGVHLAVRLGIHTGLVVVGEVGGGTRQEQLALGETPNLAARLQGIAAPNTLVISAATLPLLGGFFACQSLGTPFLRGFAQPLEVYEVLYESMARSRLEAVGSTGLTPLVGREQEVGLLLQRWAQVKDGIGQVVLLSGEAGIGKSRLVQVLKEHVAAEPQAWLTPCQCSPYYQNSALYPMTDLLERVALRCERQESPQQKLSKLEGFLMQYGLPLVEAVPLFAALLSLPLSADYVPLAVSPEQQKQKTLQALLTILLRIASQQPVLFVMEDLHWVDPTTLEFLTLLVAQGPTARILALWGLSYSHMSRAQIQTACAVGEELLGVARQLQDPVLLLEAHRTLMLPLTILGEFGLALTHMQHGLALYDPQQMRAHALRYGQDSGVTCRVFGAWCLWLLGYPDQARQWSEAALTYAQRLLHAFTLAQALLGSVITHQLRREAAVVQEQAEALRALCTEHRFAYYLAWGTVLQGSAWAAQGEWVKGLAQIREGLAAWQAVGGRALWHWFRALLAEAYGRAGQVEEGLRALEEALEALQTTEDRIYEAEVYRLKGELLLQQSAEQQGEAEESLQQALEIARRQQAKSLELRAAMSLSRLWQRQGKQAEARTVLAPIYGWFTEGFDTADLQEAKALLDELA
jgi:class 3 adenylate cyclase/predicted ATPase